MPIARPTLDPPLSEESGKICVVDITCGIVYYRENRRYRRHVSCCVVSDRRRRRRRRCRCCRRCSDDHRRTSASQKNKTSPTSRSDNDNTGRSEDHRSSTAVRFCTINCSFFRCMVPQLFIYGPRVTVTNRLPSHADFRTFSPIFLATFHTL